jgi:hypothetical protein
MGGVAVLFLAFDVAGKLLALPPVVEGTARLGYPERSLTAIGIIELVCLALYVVPRTALLGALLLTGFLGGAVATHVRIEDPLLTHILFPTYVATLLWGALVLRDGRLRDLIGRRNAVSTPRLSEEAPR